jgi:3-hydroxybutyryl-CoA dehydratase
MRGPLNYTTLQVGQNLPDLQKSISQEDIRLYAKASGDYNPIHIDEDFARQTPAGGTIAHGMLILAFASQMMTEAFGKDWLGGGHFNIRFKTPARPGDTISIQGKIRQIQDDNSRKVITCDILCSNPNGETVISGDAIVRI